MPDMYLQMTEAAKELGCSRQWVYTLIGKGELRTTKIAGHTVIIKDDQFRTIKTRREKVEREKARKLAATPAS